MYLFTGVFWNNPSEMWIDITSSKADRSTLGKIVDFVTQDDTVPQMDTRWVAESGVFDMYVMMGPKPYDVFRQYASLTGTTALPPVRLITLLLIDCVILYYDIQYVWWGQLELSNIQSCFLPPSPPVAKVNVISQDRY